MNETEAKTATIKLDNKSVEILTKVDPIHRESMINLGLALISKTFYYKTLTGELPNELVSITDLGSLNSLTIDKVDTTITTAVVKPKEEVTKKSSTSWDNF
jgi:hypothetical protein